MIFIPDFIAGGFVDDIAVIAYIVKKIQEELKAYKKWKDIKTSEEILELHGDIMDIDE